MKILRRGSASWQGGLKDGKGKISTESGALKEYPYGFASRFEGQRGSNPEELIAAAHASCFEMSSSSALSHNHPHSSIFARRPILTGIAVGAGSLLPHVFLSPEASIGFAAILIALIAGIYFGFAVVNGSSRDQMVEFNVAGLFAVAGLLGLLHWPLLLPVAYFAHAAWDLAHHNRARLALVAIPRWYVPWCVVIDIIVGVGLLVVWRIHGII